MKNILIFLAFLLYGFSLVYFVYSENKIVLLVMIIAIILGINFYKIIKD